MILFTLLCSADHQFEGWFKDNSSYEDQAARGLLGCPFCGDSNVRKAIMAPAVHSSRSKRGKAAPPHEETSPSASPAGDAGVPAVKAPPPAPPTEQQKKMMMAYAVMRHVQTYVERNFDNVGRKFPDEARKMSSGEIEERGIYGEVTTDEVKELQEEGIEIMPMPNLPKLDG